MSVEESLYSRATTHAGLSALIGTRFYPVRLLEDATLPAMRYQLISTPPADYRDHDAPQDRYLYRIQLDGLAATADAAISLREQIVAAFDGWSSGTAVGNSFVENQFTDYDSVLNRYRSMVEIVIDHIV